MPTVESIHADIDQAVTPGFRARLIARGQARAMIWRDGVLPPGTPGFSPQLSYDLHSYGYSLLELGLRLLELGGDPARARLAFEQAATALEAVMSKGARGETDRDFHFVMAAAAYHLAHLSARAYSLLTIVRGEDNFSPIERVLAQLMLRDLGALRTTLLDFRLQGTGSDATITAGFQTQWDQDEAGGEPADGLSSFLFDGVDLALTDSFFAALATFLRALERGDRGSWSKPSQAFAKALAYAPRSTCYHNGGRIASLCTCCPIFGIRVSSNACHCSRPAAMRPTGRHCANASSPR